MAPVEALADIDTLVVFDIDNTLIEPTVTLGSDQWFYWYAARLESEGLTPTAASDAANAVWNKVQPAIAVRAVEDSTPALVGRLQARGIRVMALTARSRDAAGVTETQLASAGYVMGRHAFGASRRRVGKSADMIYEDGILYVGEHASKGEALVRFLKHERHRPKRVVFADDKAKHTVTVDAALQKIGLPVVALRYGAADARVAAFDPAVAEIQYRAWSRVLTDEEAAALVKCAPTAPPPAK